MTRCDDPRTGRTSCSAEFPVLERIGWPSQSTRTCAITSHRRAFKPVTDSDVKRGHYTVGFFQPLAMSLGSLDPRGRIKHRLASSARRGQLAGPKPKLTGADVGELRLWAGSERTADQLAEMLA